MSKVLKVIPLLHSNFRVEYADGTSQVFPRGAPIPAIGVDYDEKPAPETLAPPPAPPPPEEILKNKETEDAT